MRRLLLIVLIAIAQIGAAPAPVVQRSEQPIAVPLVALLANPDRFDGKWVTVQGFLNLEYEGDAIYQNRSDFDAMLFRNAVWVDGPEFEEPAARRILSGRHVALTGRFNADMHGHFGMFAGGLAASEIRVLLSREQIRATMIPVYGELPWPLLILILLPSSLLLSIALAVRGRRTSAKPGPFLTASVLLVASTVAVFSFCRLWELPVLIPSLIRVGYGWAAPALLAELVVGSLAVIASWFFAVRGKMFLCVVFSTIQLIPPALIEARAFHLLDVPFSIHSAKDEDYRWRRTGPLPPVDAAAGPDWIDPFAT